MVPWSHAILHLCVPRNPVVIGFKSVCSLTVLSMYMHVLVYTKAVHCVYQYQKVYTCICHDEHSICMFILCLFFLVLTTLYCEVINLYVGSCQALSSHVGSCQSQIQCLYSSLDMDVYTFHLRPCPSVAFYWFCPKKVFIIWWHILWYCITCAYIHVFTLFIENREESYTNRQGLRWTVYTSMSRLYIGIAFGTDKSQHGLTRADIDEYART